MHMISTGNRGGCQPAGAPVHVRGATRDLTRDWCAAASMNTPFDSPFETARPMLTPPCLPPVRIEVASPDAWADLRAGLQQLGFEVEFGREHSLTGEVVLVTEGAFPATEGHTAFLVITREGSTLGAHTAALSGASGYFAAPFDFAALGVAIRAAATQAHTVAELTTRVARLSES